MKHPLKIAAVLMMFLASTSWAAEQHSETRAPYISVSTVRSWLEEDKPITFVDVREADEFEAGHLPGAWNVSYQRIEELVPELPTDRPIVLYCIHSAHRAPEAAKHLRQLGFSNAHVLEGGIVAWQAGGLSIHASNLAKRPTILPVTERCYGKVKSS